MLARANSQRPKSVVIYLSEAKRLVVALAQVMRYHAVS
jgi:hypothetical protein